MGAQAMAPGSPLLPGEIGAFRSHADVLAHAASNDRPTLILEDDVVLCDLTKVAVDLAIERSIVDEFDILFLQTELGHSFASIRMFHGLFEQISSQRRMPISVDQLQIIDITRSYIFGAYAYVVTPAAAGRLSAILEDEWSQGPTLPVDLLFKVSAEAGKLRIGCVFPFVTAPEFDSTRHNATTNLDQRDKAMIRPLLQYSFFARRDLAAAGATLDAILGRLDTDEPDETMDLIADALEMALTSQETTFGY